MRAGGELIMTESQRVLQLRLVVQTEDYEAAVRFYRDVLGAGQELQVHGDDSARVTILEVGRATLGPYPPLGARSIPA
jgi:predicted enzyme related to lactoylglutathione lyase